MERNQQLNIRLSVVEFARLQALAAHYEMSVSATVRLMIRRESLSLGASPGMALNVVPGNINLAGLDAAMNAASGPRRQLTRGRPGTRR